jgi:protocatechuate 3,4-dioxygenase beta subunit
MASRELGPSPLLLSRRDLLRIGAGGAAGLLVLGGCGDPASRAGADAGGVDGGPDAGLDPTPPCEETEDNIEGPFYRAGAPERADLVEEGMAGVVLSLVGRVLSTSCQPLAGALLDVWQADDRGDEPAQYDQVGWRLRGTLHADDDGAYQLRTIIPGHYLNGQQFRPAHIHVKASAAGHALLTTQLYFAGDPYNASDPFIEDALIMTLTDAGGDKRAAFDFVLAPA